jgi:hypothetical protein
LHSLRAGCRVENESRNVSGTIGIFAKQFLDYLEKDIGISSAHVISEGCNAMVNLEGRDIEIGQCTWPPRPVGRNMKANIPDMAVIEINSDMKEKISTSENISLYTAQKDALKHQKVYKRGCTTGRTDGDIDNPQFNMFGRNVMVISTRDGQNFSEPGDSGALVLTKKGSHLLALGLVFGGNLMLREDTCYNLPENASIAIYLDEAISRFEEGGVNGIIGIHRY